MRILPAIFTLALLASPPAGAAPWKNDTLGVRVDLPKGWVVVTPRAADRKIAASRDSTVQEFYREVKRGLLTGQFALFENPRDTNARADIQMQALGKRIPPLTEADIRALCPMWAKGHGEGDRPFNDCRPRKLGEAWTAFLTMAPDAAGHSQFQVKSFRPDGYVIVFTVDGTAAQAEAFFRKTRFY